MGYDAGCTIRIDGKRDRGTAWLEHKDLVFRGPFTLAIPLKDIRTASASGGTLHVRYGDKHVDLTIGRAAEKWAERIMNPPSRLAKLGIKPGMRLCVLGVDEAGFAAELESLGISWSTRPPRNGACDAMFVGVETAADLDRLSMLAGTIAPAGAIWIVRRKGRTAAVSERESMAAGKRAGLVDVKVVSFSDTHSAEKYVIPVAKRAGSSPSTRLPRKRESVPSRGRSGPFR
jgi:hypothetical protein